MELQQPYKCEMFVQLVFDRKQSGDKNIQKAEKSFLIFFLLPKKYTGHFEGNEIKIFAEL